MDSVNWSRWTTIFRRFRITAPLLFLLEDGGALRSILAQGMLALSPFLTTTSDHPWSAFAEMLDDPDASLSFAEHVRKECHES